MRGLTPLFIAFLVVPLVEIYLLIKVGGWIGAGPTVALVVLTAVVGGWLLRLQGIATLGRIQSAVDRGEVPAFEVTEGAALLVGGALLLTPGFATDALGLLCLVPVTRRWLVRSVLRRAAATRPGGGPGSAEGPPGGQVIDTEYEEIRDERKRIP